MPAAFPKERPYPGTYRKLSHAAQARQLVIVTCTGCRRVARFLAEDLVRILDPDRPADSPPFPCSKCGSRLRLRVDVISPGQSDVGLMEVRRPGPVQRVQTWRTMKLGDAYAPALPPVRPRSLFGGPASLSANLELIDRYKGWLLEHIRLLREENAAIVAGSRLALKRDAGAAWEDATAAVFAGNEQLLEHMESLVVAMDEEAEETRNNPRGY